MPPFRASVTTFTAGGHGYQEEEGLAPFGSPYHAGFDEGAISSRGELPQHAELFGAPGIQHQPPSVSSAVLASIRHCLTGTIKTAILPCVSTISSLLAVGCHDAVQGASHTGLSRVSEASLRFGSDTCTHTFLDLFAVCKSLLIWSSRTASTFPSFQFIGC